jgi:hypothetical protein
VRGRVYIESALAKLQPLDLTESGRCTNGYEWLIAKASQQLA